MSARPGKVSDFNPNSQAPGPVKSNPLSMGMTKSTAAGGSKPSSQAAQMKRGSAGGKSSAPAHRQKIRG